MLTLLWKVLRTGIVTEKAGFPQLEGHVLTLPELVEQAPCTGTSCGVCTAVCPTDAITISGDSSDTSAVGLDLGACIACGLCIKECPTGKFTKQLSTRTATTSRSGLILGESAANAARAYLAPTAGSNGKSRIFRDSLAIRVVSTGCSACDLEVGAAGNPIFDMERFGVSVVASPRMADALLVTGPVGKSMQTALRRTYEAMAEPRLVIACGTCAISGGVHRHGYAEANGADEVLPVDVYIPGCPPSPWSIIHGIMLAMGRVPPAD